MANQYEVSKEQFIELVDKMWNGEITMNELDKYEIILPFAPNHENEFINNIIIANCDDARKENHRIIFTGMFRGIYHSTMIENGFKYISEWSNGYRDVYTSENDKAIVTYCEGDFSVCLMSTPENYQIEFNSCIEFYEEN